MFCVFTRISFFLLSFVFLGKHCTMGANLIDVQKFIHNTHLPSPPGKFLSAFFLCSEIVLYF